MEVISGFVTPASGAVGILSVMVLMIAWGKLVPRSSVDVQLSDKDRQIKEWRDAYLQERRHREIGQKQVDVLLSMAHTTTAVVDAVAAAAGVTRGGESREVDEALEEEHQL